MQYDTIWPFDRDEDDRPITNSIESTYQQTKSFIDKLPKKHQSIVHTFNTVKTQNQTNKTAAIINHEIDSKTEILYVYEINRHGARAPLKDFGGQGFEV